MKNLPLSKVYPLLEPGPVVLLTTAHKGHANIMAMSWHMMVEFEPPLVACVVSNANHSFAALRAMRECVIAIPAVELAPKVVGIGNCSGRGWPTALSADPRSHQAGRAL
jgi:flavin reductase (DIM6/NTAB) family NADH-FMN oxidoreductase RutF